MSRYRYLNGIDWVVTGLDHSLRQTSGCGNWSQLVLELEGTPDFDSFSAAVQRYVSSFPVLQGRAARGWQLVPVWKMPARAAALPVPVEIRPLSPNAGFRDIIQELGRGVAAPPGTPGRYIGFTALTSPQKTWLAFRFDHRLLDARGAELFLNNLLQYVQSGSCEPPPPIELPGQKACLRPWIAKFKSGRHVVRLLHAQRHEAAPFTLPPRHNTASGTRFTVLPLTAEQSAALRARADEEAGYLLLTPWLAAQAGAYLEKRAHDRGCPLGGLMIPCSADLRTGNPPAVFFNHVGFICFSRPAGEAPAGGWARHFSRQFMEQVKTDMPRHFENAWKLARILPAPLYGRLLRGPLKTFGGTFSMASVGDGLSAIESIDSCAVRNAFHMPAVPPAPGIGFFVNTFQNRLNLCFSSCESMLSADEHNQWVQSLQTNWTV